MNFKSFYLVFCIFIFFFLNVRSSSILYDQLTGQNYTNGFVTEQIVNSKFLLFMIDDFIIPTGEIWRVNNILWAGFGNSHQNVFLSWNISFWKGTNTTLLGTDPFNTFWQGIGIVPTFATIMNFPIPSVILDSGSYFVGAWPTMNIRVMTNQSSSVSIDYFSFLRDTTNGQILGSRLLGADPNCMFWTSCSLKTLGYIDFTPPFYDLIFQVIGDRDVGNPYLVPSNSFIDPLSINLGILPSYLVTFDYYGVDDLGIQSITAKLFSPSGQILTLSFSPQGSSPYMANNWIYQLDCTATNTTVGVWVIHQITIIDIVGKTVTLLTGDLVNFTTSFTVTNIPPFTSTSSSQSPNNNAVAIALGIIIPLLVIGIIVGIIFFLLRKRNSNKPEVSFPTLEQLNENVKSPYSFITEVSPQLQQSMSTSSPTTSQRLQIDPNVAIDMKELQFGEVIGSGAFGVVYRGKWRNIQVAIKQLKFDASLSAKDLNDYYDEIALMKSLRNHVNIVMLLGVTPLGHIVTEFYDKGSLHHLILHGEKFTDDVTWKILRGIANGMLHLHTEGVIHRDLAARNILLTKYYEPKISDFGLARIVDRADASSVGKTQSNVGPLKHMAPESILRKEYSTKSDVWSFGVVIYEILARNNPYEGKDPVQAAAAVAYQGLKLTLPPDVATKWPIPNGIMKECFHNEPNSRPDFKSIVQKLGE